MLKPLLRLLAPVALLAAPLLSSADHLRPHLLLTARLNGADPLTIPAIDVLKAQLAAHRTTPC